MFHCPFLSADKTPRKQIWYRESNKFNWCFIVHFFLQKKLQGSRYGTENQINSIDVSLSISFCRKKHPRKQIWVVLPINSPNKNHNPPIFNGISYEKTTKFLGCSITPPKKTNTTMENPPFQDVFPIEHGDLPASHVSQLRGVPPSCWTLRRWTSWFWHPTFEAEAVPGNHREFSISMVIFVGWEGWCKNFVWIPRMQRISWAVMNIQMTQIQNQWAIAFSRNTGCSIGILVMFF